MMMMVVSHQISGPKTTIGMAALIEIGRFGIRSKTFRNSKSIED